MTGCNRPSHRFPAIRRSPNFRTVKQLLVIAVLALAAFTACTDAYGQDTQAQVSKPTTVEALTNELCWCFSAIDLKQSDAAIDARVKRCMEDAIVHNPAAVRTLIQYTPKQNTVGFDLGRTLGSLLDGRCAAYLRVKERLRPGRTDAAVRNSQS